MVNTKIKWFTRNLRTSHWYVMSTFVETLTFGAVNMVEIWWNLSALFFLIMGKSDT